MAAMRCAILILAAFPAATAHAQGACRREGSDAQAWKFHTMCLASRVEVPNFISQNGLRGDADLLDLLRRQAIWDAQEAFLKSGAASLKARSAGALAEVRANLGRWLQSERNLQAKGAATRNLLSERPDAPAVNDSASDGAPGSVAGGISKSVDAAASSAAETSAALQGTGAVTSGGPVSAVPRFEPPGPGDGGISQPQDLRDGPAAAPQRRGPPKDVAEAVGRGAKATGRFFGKIGRFLAGSGDKKPEPFPEPARPAEPAAPVAQPKATEPLPLIPVRPFDPSLLATLPTVEMAPPPALPSVKIETSVDRLIPPVVPQLSIPPRSAGGGSNADPRLVKNWNAMLNGISTSERATGITLSPQVRENLAVTCLRESSGNPMAIGDKHLAASSYGPCQVHAPTGAGYGATGRQMLGNFDVPVKYARDVDATCRRNFGADYPADCFAILWNKGEPSGVRYIQSYQRQGKSIANGYLNGPWAWWDWWDRVKSAGLSLLGGSR